MEKLREAALSVLPVVLIVCIVYFTPLVRLTPVELWTFLSCAVFLIIGIGLFNLGADMAMTPMGEFVGTGLTRTRKLTVLLAVSFIMGVLITVAEPDLSVLAEQVSAVMNRTTLIVFVGVGVGLFLLTGVLKILFRADLSRLLMLFYLLLFALAAFVIEKGQGIMLPLSFDSGGVTTGPITVPFIMALGIGIASSVGGKDAEENSFGLIALCSVGPILAMLILSASSSGELLYALPDYSTEAVLSAGIGRAVLKTAKEVLLALGLITVSFLILDFTILKLPKKRLLKLAVGLLYTFAGLVIFLTAVNVGFMPVGFAVGSQMADCGPAAVTVFGFVIGCAVVLAEPAVHVLNHQVEEVTGGAVSRKSMMFALSLGVGLSIGLSMLRIVCGFSLLYYLIPGYFLSLALSLFVPSIYTAIAFDSGGVASGPLTSSFILPLAVGACAASAGESAVLESAFGIVAMVAMTPLITIQSLGFFAIAKKQVKESAALRQISRSDDDQIIYFDIGMKG